MPAAARTHRALCDRAVQIAPVPAGSKLPWSLIVPVCIDAVLDGMLVGFATVASPAAGIILSIANVVEMTFVGISLAIAVAQCTGSTLRARRVTVAVPPLLLVLAAAGGAACGSAARAVPPLFAGIIAFGMVGLVYLVCAELLIAAHEALDGNEVWWVSAQIFVGIMVVLLLDRLISTE
jgi:zinc transporter ZupT